MKTALIFVFGLIIWTSGYTQSCSCEKDTVLKNIISCDTIKFDNGAKLFWSFNCDSSWLTFESPIGKKRIIFSLGDGLQILTGRLGHIYGQEYKNTFLIQNNVISGCCTPPDFYLYDKTTGQLKENMGRIIFYSENKSLPFIVSIANTNDSTSLSTNYNSLVIFNVDKAKKYLVSLPKGQILNALKLTGNMYPENLFDTPVLNGTDLSLTYILNKRNDGNNQSTDTIQIDFKKYGN